MRQPAVCVALGVALWLGASTTAAADDGAPGLRWNPRWTRFTTGQFLLTGAMAGGLLATDQLLHPSTSPRWRSGILLDRQASTLLGAESEPGRERASAVSDYLGMALVLYPFAIDSLLVAGLLHGSYDVAFQMAMIGLQGMLLAKLITGLTKDLVGRARPDAGGCQTGHELACATQNESFISGHTSGAFASAGLICAHHQNLRLYGSEAAGTIACGTSLGLATTVGTLRMVAGRHHLSDVLAGAIVGLASGYLLPNLGNYDFGDSTEAPGTLVPIADNHTLGVGYLGHW